MSKQRKMKTRKLRGWYSRKWFRPFLMPLREGRAHWRPYDQQFENAREFLSKKHAFMDRCSLIELTVLLRDIHGQRKARRKGKAA